MGGRLDPAVARVRVAVRQALQSVDVGATVAVACSGGPDSLALASATAFETRRRQVRLSAVVVDHGLQAGSGDVAARTSDRLETLGYTDVDVRRVQVDPRSGRGPEAAARDARRQAYVAHVAARDTGRHRVVLTGHTRDDQAEQVLLGLARGSGTRSLAGIPPTTTIGGGTVEVIRPLLEVPRADTLAACAAEGLDPWHDPHNEDLRYARVRARARVLPVLEKELGPGVAEALARTAGLARADADLLDERSEEAYELAGGPGGPGGPTAAHHPAEAAAGAAEVRGVRLHIDVLERAEQPILTRVLRRAAVAAGATAAELTAGHVAEMTRLLWDWSGQGPIQLPGHVSVRRTAATLRFEPTRG